MSDELDKKVEAIGKLLGLFKYERAVYMFVTVLSLIVLIGCAAYLLKENEMTIVIGLFGSSGAITYTTSRLLKMWSDSLQLLNSIEDEKDESA